MSTLGSYVANDRQDEAFSSRAERVNARPELSSNDQTAIHQDERVTSKQVGPMSMP